jgi:hypothetical protein
MSQATMKWGTSSWSFFASNLASAINQAKARYNRMGLIGRIYVTFGDTTVQVIPE